MASSSSTQSTVLPVALTGIGFPPEGLAKRTTETFPRGTSIIVMPGQQAAESRGAMAAPQWLDLQFACQFAGALCGFSNPRQRFSQSVVQVLAGQQQLAISKDYRQGVVETMQCGSACRAAHLAPGMTNALLGQSGFIHQAEIDKRG